MASTTFFPGTVIASTWLNAVNVAVYNTLPTLAPLINPSFTAPSLGAATATSINKVSFTPVATTATWNLANNKQFTVNNTVTINGTDGCVLTLGSGTTSVSGTSSGTNTGDQLTFKTISVSGQSDVVADTTGDTLTLIAGTGISLATDSVNDTVTINATGSTGTVVLLSQATVSTAVANIDFLSTFSSTYDKYIVEIQGVKSLAADILAMRLAKLGSPDSGSVYYPPAANGATAGGQTTSLVIGTTAGLSATYTAEIRNVNDPATLTTVGFRGMSQSTTGYVAVEGSYTGGNVVTGFRLYWSGGASFSNGTIRVYGIKNT